MSAILNDETKKVLTAPLVNDNPITLQVLGICSALAVTSQMSTSLIMALAFWAYTIAVALMRARTIMLEREANTEWVHHLPDVKEAA